MHTLSTLLFFLLPFASAHMDLTYPAPLNHPENPNTNAGTADFNYKSPITAAGFPCKGYHSLLGTPAGKPVETWAAGSTQNFTLGGTAVHGGGSCQASISEDGGKTFRVVKSYVGGCPAIGQAFEFVVPKEAKSGDALFAWTWFNNLGNREMYMNCAAVTISGGGSKGLSDLPEIFQANLGNGCETVPNKDLLFPTPGNDVAIVNSAAAAPVGPCGLNAPTGANSSIPPPSASSASSGSSAAATSATPVSLSSPTAFVNPTGCMCICGGPSGYAVNILPISAVDKIVDKTPAALIIDQLPTITEIAPSSSVYTGSSSNTNPVTLASANGKPPTIIESPSSVGYLQPTATIVKISSSEGVSVTTTSLSVGQEPTGVKPGMGYRFRRWQIDL